MAFNEIPNDLRVPFVAIEFDASNASQGPALLRYRNLIIGQKTSAGSGVADTAVRINSADEAIAIAGRGSMLHRQAIAWYASNQGSELWLGILEDNGAAVVSEATLTIVGTATEDSVLAVYVGGKRFPVAVVDADDQTAIALAIKTAINLDLDLPVTADSALGVVTFTHRNLGAEGNSYDVRVNHLSSDALGAGVTSATPTAFSSGATNPVLTSLIAALGDVWYNVIAHPYTDETSLTAIENELTLRNGPLKQIDGIAITSATGSVSTLAALGNTRNNRHSSIQCQPGNIPLTWPVEFAAEHAGIIAEDGQRDPARPFQTLAMVHTVPVAEADEFTLEERNSLLFDGIGTTKVSSGVVQIERPITTWQTNAAGAADDAYLDITTLLTLMYLRYSFRTQMQTRYPRHKLADDGTQFGEGQEVMTPLLGKSEALGWFRDMEELGLVEGFTKFKSDLSVIRDTLDRKRLNFVLPPDLIDQLMVTAAQIAFRG